MQAAGINVVKTYGPILDRAILDTLWAHGIAVLPTVFYGGGNSAASAIEAACAVKDHPAIVGWVVGNEWNYNRLDRDISGEEAERVVESISAALQAFDSTRPIITVYGGLPSPATLARLDEVDVWGLNVYTGPSFYELFGDWEARSAAPMFFAEYGADAYDGRIGSENETYQADVTRSLTNEIFANAANSGTGVCSGGLSSSGTTSGGSSTAAAGTLTTRPRAGTTAPTPTPACTRNGGGSSASIARRARPTTSTRA